MYLWACAGTPIDCFPIWHWYMFLGLGLKFPKGVSDATTLNVFAMRVCA